MVKEISYEELKNLIQSGGADLIDVREEGELLEGSLTESKNWPLSSFGIRREEISQKRPTIFYCRSGLRSLKAAEIAEGWTDQSVYSLEGGYLKAESSTASWE